MMRRACVIGWPVSHSRSPLIHTYWLRSLGIEGEYVRQPVEPGAAGRFLAELRERGFVGCNVTIPHKEAAFAALDDVTPIGRALAGVNTVWLEGSRLIGTSTDGEGFLANLDERTPGWSAAPGPAVVLGAGGAAKAIVWSLRERGFAPIAVVNRSLSRAEDLAKQFGPFIRADRWERLPELLRNAALLVNATSLGMAGQPPLSVPIEALPAHALVTDIVYTPLSTDLLRAARSRGLVTVDGLGMLMHQAVPGFERWFGRRPTVTDELRALLVADIEAR